MGLLDNTVIVFTTDHGISALRGKGHVYDFGVEIAHVMHLPFGMRNGYEVDHLIPNVDFMPTLLDACGVEYPDDLNGRSFWPLLAGREYTPHETLFIERNFHGEHESDTSETYIDKYDPQRGVRTKDYHYIRHFRPDARERLPYRREISGFELRRGTECSIDGVYLPELHDARPAAELYDLRHDPWEQWNMIDRPEYAGIKRDLAARLDEWMRETNDPALSPEMPLPLESECYWPTKHTPITVEHR
jgi:arylsulfatase A-like enzyme